MGPAVPTLRLHAERESHLKANENLVPVRSLPDTDARRSIAVNYLVAIASSRNARRKAGDCRHFQWPHADRSDCLSQ
jgi:hypothetical protein